MKKFILLLVVVLYCTSLFAWKRHAKLIYSYFEKTEYHNVADVITAMSILETGWYKSKNHICRNNMFSIKTIIKKNWTDCNNNPCNKPICKMHHFKTLKQGYKHVLEHFRQKHFSTNRNKFLTELTTKRYAQDKQYQDKLKWIIRVKLKNIIFQNKNRLAK